MRYLVTGGAGFIGSNIAEELVRRGKTVRILDNLSTGKASNIARIDAEFINGDIRDFEACRQAVKGVDFIFHEAALASVPRSVDNPLQSNEVNVTGTLNILIAARDEGVKRLVYASSSSVYGDNPEPTKRESAPTRPLSPYAIGKLAGEQYCRTFFRIYGLETVSLRYFNVFGIRQDPASEYAAVIPRFISSILNSTRPVIYGDGEQSRDFTFIKDVVEANILAASAPSTVAGGVFNIACNRQYSLLHLLGELQDITGKEVNPVFEEARAGDIKHSRADIELARQHLSFEPQFSFHKGLEMTVEWYRLAGKK